MADLVFVYAGDPGNANQCSPYTITRNLYNFLRPKFDRVIYYDWSSCGPFEPVRPGTVIIGHPNYPPSSATRQLFKMAHGVPGVRKFLLFPLHHAMPEINLPFDDLVTEADHVFNICGPYWYDTLPDSKFAHWQRKITRLDMAIDGHAFPYLKERYNPVGARSFVYIGCDRPEKGLDLLYEIFRRCQHRLHVYGIVGDNCSLLSLPNVSYHGWADVTVAWAIDLCALTDCFVNTSRSDANPTCLAEAAGWGLPAACTPQSGYWPGQPFFGINPGDPDGVVNLLQYVQTCDEQVLRQQAAKQRSWVDANCNWDKFCSTVWASLSTYL